MKPYLCPRQRHLLEEGKERRKKPVVVGSFKVVVSLPRRKRLQVVESCSTEEQRESDAEVEHEVPVEQAEEETEKEAEEESGDQTKSIPREQHVVPESHHSPGAEPTSAPEQQPQIADALTADLASVPTFQRSSTSPTTHPSRISSIFTSPFKPSSPPKSQAQTNFT